MNIRWLSYKRPSCCTLLHCASLVLFLLLRLPAPENASASPSPDTAAAASPSPAPANDTTPAASPSPAANNTAAAAPTSPSPGETRKECLNLPCWPQAIVPESPACWLPDLLRPGCQDDDVMPASHTKAPFIPQPSSMHHSRGLLTVLSAATAVGDAVENVSPSSSPAAGIAPALLLELLIMQPQHLHQGMSPVQTSAPLPPAPMTLTPQHQQQEMPTAQAQAQTPPQKSLQQSMPPCRAPAQALLVTGAARQPQATAAAHPAWQVIDWWQEPDRRKAIYLQGDMRRLELSSRLLLLLLLLQLLLLWMLHAGQRGLSFMKQEDQ